MESPYQLYVGDCLETLRNLPDNSADSIVTDPPYGLSKEPDMAEVLRHWLAGDDYQHKGGGFMGKTWDSFVPGPSIWRECLRVLKPGGHLLAFFGTRTQDMGTLAIRLAGFEIRDSIAWVYGSGFPKSLDVSKAIDKAAGAEREVLAVVDPRSKFDGRERSSAAVNTNWRGAEGCDDVRDLSRKEVTAPATDAARQWQGWGTALKPALEPITVARKPLVGTVAQNVLAHGTGALNIDGCRVAMLEGEENPSIARYASTQQQGNNGWGHVNRGARFDEAAAESAALGRWPANLIHDGDAAADMLGDAARFFYCAKTSKRDRGEGNNHPTVKPTDLMAYLCRLVTPPGGVVLDPFMGSGSTGKAAMREGFRFIGCELSPEYLAIAEARISNEIDDLDDLDDLI